ncbi:Mitochondrial import inner membrane translocase subunit Tim17/Tim22/Tim23 family protein [Euphorbia peplus]|nr:Mitochondrial import inner membrane translocase subunit Tim17/Tim22/Tim23 family protein [Euphorbia peplus]
MEDVKGMTPCSSLGVHSAIQVGTAGGIWGSCLGPHQARQIGLTGTARAVFVGKSIGKFSFQFGLVGGVCALTRCGVQRYRGKNDWVNAFIGGAAAGAVFSAGTRNWRQVAGIAGLVAVCSAAADYSETF